MCCAAWADCRRRDPTVAYGGWIFNERPELRARTAGVYLGADARPAAAKVTQLLGASRRAHPV
jgi:hypothetical protein